MASQDLLNPNLYSGYHLFLLRLWQDGPEGPWYALLLDEHGRRKVFADFDALADFLRGQINNTHQKDNNLGQNGMSTPPID